MFAMFLIPCRVLFEGGPHDGFFAEREYIPEKQIVVPADARWRDHWSADGDDPPPGMAAIYVWRNTQIVGDPGNPEILLRYRFLTYHSKLAPADPNRHHSHSQTSKAPAQGDERPAAR